MSFLRTQETEKSSEKKISKKKKAKKKERLEEEAEEDGEGDGDGGWEKVKGGVPLVKVRWNQDKNHILHVPVSLCHSAVQFIVS